MKDLANLNLVEMAPVYLDWSWSSLFLKNLRLGTPTSYGGSLFHLSGTSLENTCFLAFVHSAFCKILRQIIVPKSSLTPSISVVKLQDKKYKNMGFNLPALTKYSYFSYQLQFWALYTNQTINFLDFSPHNSGPIVDYKYVY